MIKVMVGMGETSRTEVGVGATKENHRLQKKKITKTNKKKNQRNPN